MPLRSASLFVLVCLLGCASVPALAQSPPSQSGKPSEPQAPAQAPPPATSAATPANLIAVGTSREGTLTPSDLMLPDGSYYDFYRFQAEQGRQYRITLSSLDFDTFLKVTGPEKDGKRDRWVHDDLGPERTDSDLVFVASSTGTYDVTVNAFAEGETGRYRLSITTTDGSFENAPRQDEPSRAVPEGQLTT